MHWLLPEDLAVIVRLSIDVCFTLIRRSCSHVLEELIFVVCWESVKLVH